jgi:formylglycine-generating enzyme required for sulfatase activity
MIGSNEVTNAEFRRFRNRHNSGSEQGNNLNDPDKPVVSVSWDDAARYANWLSNKERLPPAYREINGKMVAVEPLTTGYRLPTEAEWVFAARYDGGRVPLDQPLKYAWGQSMPPLINSGNFADRSASGRLPFVLKGYRDGYPVSAPVAKFKPNESGIHDLAGNVAEWCHDYYDTTISIDRAVDRDPSGPKSGTFHVVRGSSWRHGEITQLRLSYRDYARGPRNDLGFRIARYVELSK